MRSNNFSKDEIRAKLIRNSDSNSIFIDPNSKSLSTICGTNPEMLKSHHKRPDNKQQQTFKKDLKTVKENLSPNILPTFDSLMFSNLQQSNSKQTTQTKIGKIRYETSKNGRCNSAYNVMKVLNNDTTKTSDVITTKTSAVKSVKHMTPTRYHSQRHKKGFNELKSYNSTINKESEQKLNSQIFSENSPKFSGILGGSSAVKTDEELKPFSINC